MTPKIHLYEALCSDLGTDYYLTDGHKFHAEVDTADATSRVGARVRELSLHKGPAAGLSELLNNSPVVVLQQIPREFGWFWVVAQIQK
jgi:hypothetical protein